MPKQLKAGEQCPACNQLIKPLTVAAFINIDLHDNGAMSIQGNIGDVRLALQMLDAARARIADQIGRPCITEPLGRGLELPHNDVQAKPKEKIYPLTPEGDLRKAR